MEEKDKLKKLSLEELQIEQKKFKSITISLGTVILFALITAIYFAFKNNSYSMFIYLGGFSGIIYVLNEKLQKIETEIKLQNS